MLLKTFANYPQRQGIIRGFSNAPTEYAAFIRSDLALSMPIVTLSHLQNHYRILEKRDPSVDELIMLDILFENSRNRKGSNIHYMLAELITKNNEIRATFSDLMAKLSAIEPDRQGPPSFEALHSAAGKYIASAIKSRYTQSAAIADFEKNSSAISAIAKGANEAEDYLAGDKNFTVSDRIEGPRLKTGVYLQIARSDSFEELIKAMRADRSLKFSARIVENNIIEEIIADSESAIIYVPESMAAMATFGEGDLLICCPKKQEAAIAEMITSGGMRFRRAGKKLKHGKIKFACPSFTPELNAALIRNLLSFEQRELVSIDISDEMIKAAPNCKFEMIRTIPKKHRLETIESYDGDRGDIAIISAKSCFETSPYMSGIAQTVCAAASAIAASDSPEDIRLTNCISFPKRCSPSVLAAHLLGIYRAEIELFFSAMENHLEISPEINKAVSRTLAIAKRSNTRATDSGSLWLVSPDMGTDEISFESIRKTFSYISEFRSKNIPARICALDCDGIGGFDGFGDISESLQGKNVGIGAFLVLTDAELLPANGILTEKIGAVSFEVMAKNPAEI